jgi:threonyl-tRNA synthetase
MFSDKVWLWLPLWLPNGAMLWKMVEDFWKDAHEKNGYDFVRSPHIWNKVLWETSGHWWFYADSMYPPMEAGQSLEELKSWVKIDESEVFLLKPMNCPFHVEIYREEPKSYREFPLRWCEIGTVYRFEKKWQLSGLTRVRWFTQDDAHIVCRRDQVEDELKRVVNFILYIYESFWFDKNKVKVYLSLRDPNNKAKYSWNDEGWDLTQEVLENVAKEMWLDYTKEEWEAAFYWPKLDFKLKDVLGREWQCSTLQFDFNLPERFNMTFKNAKWEEEKPYMLHRALFGSFERFIWLLIEHYAWAFPIWLAPKQVIVVPVSEVFNDYADKIYGQLKANGIRIEIDKSSDSLNKKVRNAEQMHINYILVVWEKEKDSNSVAVRNYRTKEQSEKSTEDFINEILEEIKDKRI